MTRNSESHACDRDEHGTVSTALIDTSLLVELQKERRYAAPVKQSLKHFRFKGISSFSLLEFKWVWPKRAVYLYSIARKESVTCVRDVMSEVEKKLANHPGSLRMMRTCYQLIMEFLERPGFSDVADFRTLKMFRAHCRRIALYAIYDLIEDATSVLRNTDCVRADEMPKETASGNLDLTITQCRPSDISCRLHEFFSDHLEDFLSVMDAGEKQDASPELAEIAKQIKLAKSDPERLCDDRNCRKIGDAIIAIDGIGMGTYVANNDKEWKPIARALGKTLINPVKDTQHSSDTN